MKKIFFLICCSICFCYVYTQSIATETLSGVMNAELHMQNYGDIYLHDGIDVYWTFLEDASTSERPYLPAYSGGMIFVDYVNMENINAGVDMIIDPSTKHFFGAGHCNYNLLPDTTETMQLTLLSNIQTQINLLVAKPGSKLENLNPKIRDNLLWVYVTNNPSIGAYHNYLTHGASVSGNWLFIPSISSGDLIAVLGDYAGPAGPKKKQHFHLHLYGMNSVGSFFFNLGNFNLRNYVCDLLTGKPTPAFLMERMWLRQNYNDHVCADRPNHTHNCITTESGPAYAQLPDLTATPSIGFPTPSCKVVVFADCDIIQDAHVLEGWKNMFVDRIAYKVNRILPTATRIAGRTTCKPKKQNIVYGTPFVAPQNVSLTDDSFGVTFPPHVLNTQLPNIVATINPSGEIRNWNYGYIHELGNPHDTYSSNAPFNWNNNPHTNEALGSSEIFRAPWILSNLHTKYSSNGEFRFDPRNRYLCWNSSVHKEYKDDEDEVQWWLPPQLSGRTYPPLVDGLVTPSHAPQFTDNLAYNPNFALFPDGRYNIESEYTLTRGDLQTHETADFYVDNYKPYLRYISVQQQQIDWEGSSSAWRDPDVESDWLAREDATEKTIFPFPAEGNYRKKVYREYCVYLAYYDYVGKQPSGYYGENPGEDGQLRLYTRDLKMDPSKVYVGDYCNFDTSGVNARAKRWVNGRKPLYFELDFSEPIDEGTFYLDLEDRYGNFRAMIGPGDYLPTPQGMTESSSIFDYYNFDDASEKGFMFKYGSNNKTIIVKLPALSKYMTKVDGQWVSEAIFDGAERRIFIHCKDEAGTELACMEEITESCKHALCRSANELGLFIPEWGDSWLHRLSIDTVTEARCQISPQGQHNWPAVEEQIQSLENNGDYKNIFNWHWLHNDACCVACYAWTVEYDPKRNIQRQSIDGSWMYDSSGSRETRVQIGMVKVDDRQNEAFIRIKTGRSLGFYAAYYAGVYISCYTVDACGNKDSARGYVQCDPPPPPTYSWYTAPPQTSITAPPPTENWWTTAPPTIPPTSIRISNPDFSTGPPGSEDPEPPHGGNYGTAQPTPTVTS